MYIFPDALLQEIILALESDIVLFPAGCVMRLYTNDFTPTRASVIGDFTQLTNVQVPGYAAVPLAWDGTPTRNPDGTWQDYANDSLFQATGAPPAPQLVYGWYLTDAAGAVWVGAGRLSVPFSFLSIGDGFRLEPTLKTSQETGTTVVLTADQVQS